MRVGLLLRGGAVAIALLALLDPAVTVRREVDAEVAVVRAPAAPGEGGAPLDALVGAVARAVDSRFRAVRGPWGGAAATVLVGEGFPDGVAGLPDPVFRVVSADAATRPHLLRVELPGPIPLQGRALVRVVLGLPGAEPPPALVLLSGGVEVSRATPRALAGARDGARLFAADLDFVPPAPGVHTLEVAVGEGDAGDGAGPRALAYPVVEVVEEPWSVLFLDTRPAWGSTFLRRALDGDPRFAVVGRVETAPGVVTTFGDPPAVPTAPGALAPHDLVVVGAPELLERPLATALDGWVRAGGSLLLLPDEAPGADAAPRLWEELAGVAGWIVEESDAPLPLALGDALGDAVGAAPDPAPGPALRTRLRSLPRAAPAGIRPWATDPEGRPVVWSRPLGEGRVIVSGAHDAWHFRTDEESAFTPTWRAIAARAAALVPPPLELHLAPGRAPGAVPAGHLPPPGGGIALPPGAPLHLAVVSHNGGGAAPAPPTTIRLVAEARVESPLPLWPTPTAGVLEAALRAPDAPGTGWVEVAVEGDTARAPLVVDPRVARADPGADPAFLRLWGRARGGDVVSAGDTDALLDALEAALDLDRHPERSHPMRSPWWIVPFSLLLAGEWWLRRRRGLP